MKRTIVFITVLAAMCSPLVNAQQRAADSTHIYHNAQRVMPDIPTGGGNSVSNPALQPPNSVNELMTRWNAIIIEFNWMDGLALNRVAVLGSAQTNPPVMDIQASHAWGCWQLNDLHRTTCEGSGFYIDVTQNGIFWRLAGCVSPAYGDLRGDGQYLWTDYLDDGGPPGGLKQQTMRVTLKRMTVSGTCRVDGAG